MPPDVRNALAGLLLAAGAFALFGWNEHRIVDRENALEALLDSAIPVRGDAIDDGLEGKLVLVQGPLRGSGPLRDGKVPYEATAVRLRRTVQMYQWETRVEKREETAPDGIKRTVESEIFTRVWSEEPIETSGRDASHANPEFPFETATFDAEAPRVGSYRVPAELVSAIDAWQAVPAVDAVAGRARLGRPVFAKGTYYFVGEDPDAPQVGDLRVAHQIVPEGITVSAIGKQAGHALAAFEFRGELIEPSLLEGEHGAREIYQAGPASSRPLAWVARVASVVLVCLAFFLLLGPFVRLRERQDVLGDLARAGAVLTSLVLGLSIPLVVAGAIWIAAGQYLGIGLVVLGVGILALGIRGRVAAGRARRPKIAA